MPMRTIVVTGAASGIGAATTDRLERAGHRVVGVDVQPGEIVADLGRVEGRRAAAEAVVAVAPDGLDGVVSGAGLGPYSDPEAVIRVNYFGAVAMLEALRPLLARGHEPAAVAISSIGAIFAEVAPDQAVPDCLAACLAGDEEAAVAAIAGRSGNDAYCVAKRALALRVRASAQDWGAAGIRLNALAPGTTETPMLEEIYRTEGIGDAVRAMPIPIGRPGRPEDLAGVIDFLLGPDARFVHGTVVFADGGSDALVRPEVI